MNNPMAALDKQRPLDFHTSLGVIGQLLALQSQQPFSIGLYYQLVRTAMEQQQCFIALNTQHQPVGAIIWMQCNVDLISELQSSGWGNEEDLLTLMARHQPHAEQYLLVHINSPFGQQLELISAWQQFAKNEQHSCWALADMGHASLRKVF